MGKKRLKGRGVRVTGGIAFWRGFRPQVGLKATERDRTYRKDHHPVSHDSLLFIYFINRKKAIY